MCILCRAFFTCFVGLGFSPTLTQAQQLRQPTSVLPWSAAQPELKLAALSPVSDSQIDSPAWLIDTGKQQTKSSSAHTGLHMVETESFVDLGPLDSEPTSQQTRSAQRQQSSQGKGNRSFNFFRALGIQATRPGNRK